MLALSAPLAAGRWSLAILGIPLIALSVAEAYAAFVSPQRAEASAYLPSLLAMLLGIGTALDFPLQPAVSDWAFYPRTDRLREKMDAEMPM